MGAKVLKIDSRMQTEWLATNNEEDEESLMLDRINQRLDKLKSENKELKKSEI